MVQEPNLNLEEIKQALENKSGYPYELEIVRRVETYEDLVFFVLPNYSFEDHDSGQARELDFHATAAVPISTRESEYAFVEILGSCKDNKNPYVFFTRQMPLAGVMLNSDVPIAGCPLEIYGDGDEEAIEWYLRLHELLHIGKIDIVSSQFCELKKLEVKSGVIFNDALIPLIKALSRGIESRNKACVPSENRTLPEYTIYYPLLVLKGPILEYHVPPEGPAVLREAKHILVIRHYESKTVKGRYAIDVIHESYLEQYLDTVKKEINTFVNRVRRHKKAIVRSIEKIAELDAEKVGDETSG